MLKCLDSRAQKATVTSKSGVQSKASRATSGSTATAATAVSPTLHRYANVTRKRDLSQYLEDERKKGKGPTAPTAAATGRGITPIYAAAAQVGSLVLPKDATAIVLDPNNTTKEHPNLNTEKDPKKPYFRAFEHPFILIDDLALLHAPIWKEFGPDALKTSKSGEPWPVLHWHCPVGYCPFVQPPTTKTISPVSHHHTHHQQQQQLAAKASRGITTRSKAHTVPVEESVMAQVVPKPRPKRSVVLNANRARPGYCECCYERYSDLSKHVSSLFHRQFALEDKNYADLDRLLLQLQRKPLQSSDIVVSSNIDLPQNSTTLLRSPISQKSSISDCNGSIGRNYTANKRAKQTQALKEFKPFNMADKENAVENCGGNVVQTPSSALPAPPTSPSFKRRRSTRIPQLARLDC